jgi:hypothetical protein
VLGPLNSLLWYVPKQHAQVQADALLHEHTAIQKYLARHAPDGSRLPAFVRSGELSLECLAQSAQPAQPAQ